MCPEGGQEGEEPGTTFQEEGCLAGAMEGRRISYVQTFREYFNVEKKEELFCMAPEGQN